MNHGFIRYFRCQPATHGTKFMDFTRLRPSLLVSSLARMAAKLRIAQLDVHNRDLRKDFKNLMVNLIKILIAVIYVPSVVLAVACVAILSIIDKDFDQ